MADMQMSVEELFMEIGKLTIIKNKLEAQVSQLEAEIKAMKEAKA